MVIIGTLVGFAALQLRDADPASRIQQQARTLAALVEARCEQSVLQARILGLRLVPGGYDFWVPHDDEWTPEPTSEGPFRPRQFELVPELELIMDGRVVEVDEDRLEPQILCLPDGTLTPFELEMGRGRRALARLEGRLNGQLELERLE